MRVAECLPSFSLSVAVLTFLYLPAAGAQEEREVPQEEIERYEDARKAARNQRVERAVEENETGTDPRSFANQWAPFYRYTELENGLVQQELVASGVFGFTPRLGMIYEVPLVQHRDFRRRTGTSRGR